LYHSNDRGIVNKYIEYFLGFCFLIGVLIMMMLVGWIEESPANTSSQLRWTCSSWSTCKKVPMTKCLKTSCYTNNPIAIVRSIFGVAQSTRAQHVAWCESKYYMWAKNGKYYGVFQMSSSARLKYSNGNYYGFYNQVLAAHRMYKKEGWKPWASCL